MRSLAKALARGLILAAIVALALPAVADRAGVKVKGTISAIDLIGSTVTVTPARGGADVTVTVDASTRITRNRRAAGLADLLVGDSVEVKYNPTTLVASKIEVKSPGSGSTPTAEVKGTVTAVDPLLGTLTVTSTLTSGSVTVQSGRNHQDRAGRCASYVSRYSGWRLRRGEIQSDDLCRHQD